MPIPTTLKRSPGPIAAFVASMIAAAASPSQAGTATSDTNAWPAPSTPAALPQSQTPFAGKIGTYVTDSTPAWPQLPTAPKGAPNVVIILIDDAGFAATDLYGGPVATPAIDALASQGLHYNNFNVAAICSPTRAELLTGRNHHRVGFANVVETANGYPGYNGLWKLSTACVAEVLRDDGYSTAAFGKWHNTPLWEVSPVGPFTRWPTGLGFEYYYGFMGGEDSEYEPRLFENTTEVYPSKTPAQGYYFTTDIADHAITWLHTHEALAPNRPYFLYFATGATHAPHHVQAQWIKQYQGRFAEGWDNLREEIFARQKKLGIIPANTVLTPRPSVLPAWSTLSPDEQRLAARQMAVYAGYMAETDHQIGRVLKAIQAGPDASNTLIFYIIGDNGASAEGGVEGSDHELASMLGGPESAAQQLKNIDALGGPTLDNHYSAGWAWALDTPFQWMKQIASHFGGTRDPLIVVWPDKIKNHGGLRTQFAHVNDIVPTIYQVAGITPPTTVNGVKQQPFDGTSLAYTFDHPEAPSRHHVQYFEIFGNRAIYDDGWIAAARHGVPWSEIRHATTDFSRDRWELYHVADDFSEAHDLAAKDPEKLAELQKVFDREARANGVYPIGGANLFSQGAPSLVKGRHEFVFYPSLPLTPPGALAPIFSEEHRITAHLNVPKSGAQGTILSYGSRFGGFTLYVKDGHVTYDNNYAGSSHDIITSSTVLPSGEVSVAFDYAPPVAAKANPAQFATAAGTGRLYVNGTLVGEGPVKPDLFSYFGSFAVGRSYDSPISAAYQGPFPFTGSIDKVIVRVQ
jgi:arylsulfatase A-like enzyme